MRFSWLSIPAASLLVVLTSCVNNGGLTASNNPSGTGPFDSRGNYIEAWADSPSQWRKGSATQVAEVQPDRPAAEVPVSPSQVMVANTPPKPVVASNSSTMVVYKKPTPRPAEVSNSSAKPKPTAAAKKPVAKKAVVKAKPKTNRYTVRSGDNLYNIAKRNGTTVSAIQKANGIKGSNIRPGQTMVIPR